MKIPTDPLRTERERVQRRREERIRIPIITLERMKKAQEKRDRKRTKKVNDLAMEINASSE